jgi:hypothetical protein
MTFADVGVIAQVVFNVSVAVWIIAHHVQGSRVAEIQRLNERLRELLEGLRA